MSVRIKNYNANAGEQFRSFFILILTALIKLYFSFFCLTCYSRALFPSTNMNGNKLTNSEIKGYASRSRVGGQFAVVGKSCFKNKKINSLKILCNHHSYFQNKKDSKHFF